jgi:hypothetical protein
VGGPQIAPPLVQTKRSLTQPTIFREPLCPSPSHADAGPSSGAAGSPGRMPGQGVLVWMLEELTRPRALVLIPAVALASWFLMGRAAGRKGYGEVNDKVKAWFNPQ